MPEIKATCEDGEDEAREQSQIQPWAEGQWAGVHGLVRHALEFKLCPEENGYTHKGLSKVQHKVTYNSEESIWSNVRAVKPDARYQWDY